VWQYRSAMRPMGRLRRGVRQIAAGRFSDRLEPERDREFAELVGDFNRMAGELDSLYRELEEKVAARSKELVRSERLASVGFLAAGVAHEINNPLGIMSGHAELALRALERGGDANAVAIDDKAIEETKTALHVVCDEAFRCKEIIRKLLSLTRPGGETRGPVSLAEVARDVATMVGGLKHYRDRTLDLKLDETDGLTVLGNETELKQVLLNLTVNALEATEPNVGRVTIEAQRHGPMVRLCVLDNGRGMAPDVLDRVFEPFFTQRRGTPGPDGAGTGLGLSITHVIVEQHGGRITAQSEGPGKGSRFTADLPAADAIAPK
jgi:two-component system, NtrC family, sensor kinase